MNLQKEKKDKILNLNWKNDDLNKFKRINNYINQQKEMVIFIKGKENYIRNVNKNIEKWIEKSNNIKVIDCYDMEEVSEKIDNIMIKLDGTENKEKLGANAILGVSIARFLCLDQLCSNTHKTRDS